MKIFPSRNPKVLSIDIGSSEIKLVEGQDSKKGLNITKAFSIEMPENIYKDGIILDSELISEKIKNALSENEIKTKNTYCTINSTKIISREINIPKVPEKEVESVIGYQINDFLPIDPEEYVIQHMLMDTFIENEVEKFNIILIAVPKTMVLNHLEILENAGLKARVLDFQGNSISKLIRYNTSINHEHDTSDLVLAVVDMGHDSSKISIINNGDIEVTRVLEPGGKDLYNNISSLFDYSMEESREKVREIEDINEESQEFSDYYRMINASKSTINTLAENIENIIRYYRTKETGNDIDIILLQGGLSNIKGLEKMFSDYFNIPTIVLSNLDKINFDDDLSKYSNAIGGLIRIGEV